MYYWGSKSCSLRSIPSISQHFPAFPSISQPLCYPISPISPLPGSVVPQFLFSAVATMEILVDHSLGIPTDMVELDDKHRWRPSVIIH